MRPVVRNTDFGVPDQVRHKPSCPATGNEINRCSDTCVAKYCGCRRRGRRYCRIPDACIVTRVKILRDCSGGNCRLGETYGIEMGSVWTSGGCQGRFWVCFNDGCSINTITPDAQTITYGGYGGGYGGFGIYGGRGDW